MKNRLFKPIIFALSLLSLVSCDKEEKDLTVDSLMPINTGNYWTFRHTYYNMDEESIDTTKIEIGDKVTINGITCYASVKESPDNASFIVGNDEVGNLVSYGGFSNLDTLQITSIQFKKDAVLGEEWDYTSVSFNWEEGTFDQDELLVKCISADTIITTPKGSFHCKGFEESRNSGADTFRYYLALNVGIVRMEYFESGDLFSFDELIDYHLNE